MLFVSVVMLIVFVVGIELWCENVVIVLVVLYSIEFVSYGCVFLLCESVCSVLVVIVRLCVLIVMFIICVVCVVLFLLI